MLIHLMSFYQLYRFLACQVLDVKTDDQHTAQAVFQLFP